MKLPLPKSVRLKQITNFPTPFLLVSCILMGQFFISWRLVITLTACQLVQTFLTNITKFALFATHCQWDFQRVTWMLVSRDFQRFPEISRDFQRPTWMLVSSRYQRGKVGAGCVQWPKQCESGAAGGNLVNLGKNTLLGRLPTNATNCTSTFNNFRLQIRDFYEYVPSIHEIQSALFIGYVGTGYHFLQLDLFLLFS